MPRVDSKFGERVAAVLEEHGLGKRQQTVRTGIDHVTVGKMMDGIIPSLETIEKFARGFGLDVNEWRELTGYEPVVAAPDLSRLSFGQHDSPANRAEETLARLYTKYTAPALGYVHVPHPTEDASRFEGAEIPTERDADQVIARWLEVVAQRNPGKPVPELAEYEERLAEE